MRQSSRHFEPGLEWRAVLDDGPEYVHSASGKGDDRLMVSFSLAPFAVVEGAAVIVSERAKADSSGS